MPIINEFEYFKPATVAQTLKLLAKYPQSAILAGGTDLLNLLKDGSAQPEAVIDIKGLADLRKITFAGGRLQIGALVTFAELIESEIVKRYFPLIVETAGTVGSTGIRNRATMAGNICTAVPCLDSGPLLLAYDAVVSAVGRGREKGNSRCRVVCRAQKNRSEARRNGQRITVPSAGGKACWLLHQAGALCRRRPGPGQRADHGPSRQPLPHRLRLGGPGPVQGRPDRSAAQRQRTRCPAPRRGQRPGLRQISPITDIRSTDEYRLHMCRVMLERALLASVERLAGGGPRCGEKRL